MKLALFPTLKNYKKEYLPKDLFSGIIIAAVSIPISMGYAQIAGLPAVYGLYGSLLPILFFALFSTSKQFIFGVDAAPAAIVGAALSTLGISFESSAAMEYVPAIALFAGLWLLLFYFLHADRIVDFISTPVMGGFISGIAVTIILMQIPKLLGSPAGTGELMELLHHLAVCGDMQPASCGRRAMDGVGIPCRRAQAALDDLHTGYFHFVRMCKLFLYRSIQGWRSASGSGYRICGRSGGGSCPVCLLYR